jgi:hypothetical protein
MISIRTEMRLSVISLLTKIRLAVISIRTRARNKESNICRNCLSKKKTFFANIIFFCDTGTEWDMHADRRTEAWLMYGCRPVIDLMYIIENSYDVTAPCSSVNTVTILRVRRLESVGSISGLRVAPSLPH